MSSLTSMQRIVARAKHDGPEQYTRFRTLCIDEEANWYSRCVHANITAYPLEPLASETCPCGEADLLLNCFGSKTISYAPQIVVPMPSRHTIDDQHQQSSESITVM